jgi:hypothetical protein
MRDCFIFNDVLTNNLFVRGFSGIKFGWIAGRGADISSTPTSCGIERLYGTNMRFPATGGGKVIGAGLRTGVAGCGGLAEISQATTTCRMKFTAAVDGTGSVSV